MIKVEATPERAAAARHARTGAWTFGPEGTLAITENKTLGEMVGAGLIEPRFVTPQQALDGRSDTYRLTGRGDIWLDRHEATLAAGSRTGTPDTLAEVRP